MSRIGEDHLNIARRRFLRATGLAATLGLPVGALASRAVPDDPDAALVEDWNRLRTISDAIEHYPGDMPDHLSEAYSAQEQRIVHAPCHGPLGMAIKLTLLRQVLLETSPTWDCEIIILDSCLGLLPTVGA